MLLGVPCLLTTAGIDWGVEKKVVKADFRKRFTHVPDHVHEDLWQLERECAIYTDHWIDELGDFRHVRIPFTPHEVEDYFRRCWAYELFLRAGGTKWARDVPAIDRDIAEEADAYSMRLKDGTTEPPPYHCFAAFLGSHLEQLTCGVSERRIIIDLHGKELQLFNIRRIIESLTPTIRSFNNREKALAPWSITCEDDVRDLLYVMLRPIVFDISKEEPIPSRGGTFKFVDLCSNAIRLMLELKWIDRRYQWKRIVDQIHIDTQSYIAHPSCQTLFFIIVDCIRDIPDPRRLESELSGRQRLADRDIEVIVMVCEP